MGIFAIGLAVVLIMVLAIKRINIGLAMLAGSVLICVGIPLQPQAVAEACKSALLSPVTWELAAAVLLIGALGYVLKASGALDVMVDSLLKLLGDPRGILLVLPSLIGALTVPGGAMMSAPMVDQLGDRVGIGPEYKTGINIIFRHIWYIALPIIPSLILAASLAGISPRQLAVLNLPALAAGVVAGWLLLLHRLPGKNRGNWNNGDFRRFVLSILPILLIIGAYLLLGINFVLALLIGIVAALLNLPEPGQGNIAARMAGTALRRAKTMILPGLRPQLLLVVAGVMLFKELLAASDVLTDFAADLIGLGIPMWLLLTVLPLLIGLATGSHEAAVGIAMPIFVGLLPANTYLAGVGLTYIAATMGYMTSPLHLCLILTREFFNARFAKIYRYTAPVALAMLIAGLVTALVRGFRFVR